MATGRWPLTAVRVSMLGALGAVAGVLVATPAVGAPGASVQARRPVVVVLPVVGTSQAELELGLGIADRAGAELYGTGRFDHFHVKQALSMLRHHGLAPEAVVTEAAAREAAAILGADVVAWGTLKRRKLEVWAAQVSGTKTSHNSVALPAGEAASLRAGGRALAEQVAALSGEAVKLGSTAHPDTQSDVAARAYLSCFRVLVRQPMGQRESHVIDPAVLAAARASCLQAVEADDGFAAAWAAYSLASSLSMEHQAAAQALAKARAAGGYLPLTTLAHYWLATRFVGAARGEAVLGDAAKAWPGALMVLTYLGEHLNVAGRYPEARDAWGTYLRHVPQSAYGMAQKGYSLARLGEMAASLALSRRAVELDPKSSDLKLELASRLVDAKQLDEAVKVLEPLVAAASPRGEAVLRLGYVELLRGRAKEAEALLGQALDHATTPGEWRTRGRARFDLAILRGRDKNYDAAEGLLLAAAADGYRPTSAVLAQFPELRPLLARPKVREEVLGAQPAPRRKPDLFGTPFPVNGVGEIDLTGEPPPKLVGFQF